MQLNINRPILFQPIQTVLVSVQVTPTPIFPIQNKSDLIDSFIISLDAGAANNVFLGDQGVSTLTGIEIIAGGGPINFVKRNQRQQYDTQIPLIDMSDTMQCRDNMPFAIPFVVWDLSQVYLVAIAITSVRVMPFRSQFI